jgi:F-type H+-transporting ATPase subunit epsilon
MRLVVTTPLAVLIDVGDVRHVGAEDETGSFGILPGHADFLTALTVSVVSWRNQADEEHQVAVRGGILTVHAGNLVEIAAREAIGEDTLAKLGPAVLEQLRRQEQSEKEAWVSATRLQLAAIRYVQRYLEAGRARAPRRPFAGSPPGGDGYLGDE